MARIVISGYYGFNNTGDEAVLYSILRLFRSLRPDLKFTVLSHDPAKTSKLYNVEAVNRWKLREVFRALRQADLLLSGGGSLLQDVTSTRSLYYYLGVVALAKLLGKPVVYYAQGVGPITSEWGQRLVSLISNKVDVITVRDQASKDLLLKLKVNRPPIYVTADAVLSLYHREIERYPGQVLLERHGVDLEKDQPLIGISVREYRNLSGYLKVLAQLGDELVRRGFRVLLLPFHFPDDVGVCREVARLMKEEAVLIKEQCTAIEMLGVLGELKLVIGMRLHALIMAAVMGVPSVGISYDPKIDSFLKISEMPNAGRVETLDYSVLSREVFSVLDNYEETLERLAQRVSELRVESRRTAEYVLALLK